MPNKRFYKRLGEAFQNSREVIKERQIILKLAKAETDRKYHSVRRELDDMKLKLKASKDDPIAYNRYKKDIDYLQQCLNNWQQTLDHIAIWEKELKGD